MSPIVAMQSALPGVALPGHPIESWQTVVVLGLIVSAVIATVWILIPSITLPPKGKEEWKIMLLMWIIIFSSSLPIGAAVGFASNVVPFLVKVSETENALEKHYKFFDIEGLPQQASIQDEEVTIFLDREDQEEGNRWINCLVSTNKVGYLPFKCETREKDNFELVEDPDNFDYFFTEEEDSFWN